MLQLESVGKKTKNHDAIGKTEHIYTVLETPREDYFTGLLFGSCQDLFQADDVNLLHLYVKRCSRQHGQSWCCGWIFSQN